MTRVVVAPAETDGDDEEILGGAGAVRMLEAAVLLSRWDARFVAFLPAR